MKREGSVNPARSTGSRRGTPTDNPAQPQRDMTKGGAHKVLKATASAPMHFDGAPKSFDSGGKRPGNTC